MRDSILIPTFRHKLSDQVFADETVEYNRNWAACNAIPDEIKLPTLQVDKVHGAVGARLCVLASLKVYVQDIVGREKMDLLETLSTIASADINARYSALDVKTKTRNEHSIALLIAAGKGYADAVRALLEAGASMEISDMYKRTPLHVAAYNGSSATVGVLLDELERVEGKNVLNAINKGDSDGRTVLHAAASRGDSDTIKLLVEKKASLEAKDSMGRSVIHMAACSASIDSIKYILEQFSKAKIPFTEHDYDGISPSGYLPQIKSLRRSQGDFNIDSVESVFTLKGECSLRSVFYCPSGKRGYFEVEILKMNGPLSLGFANESWDGEEELCNEDGNFEVELLKMNSSQFFDGEGVFWAIEGQRGLKIYGKSESPAFNFSEGDVVCFACDSQSGKMYVLVNGRFGKPYGLVFDNLPVDLQSKFFPAISGNSCSVRYNFGARRFKHLLDFSVTLECLISYLSIVEDMIMVAGRRSVEK